MNVIATSDNVVAEIEKVDNVTSGGILLPNNVGPESFLRGRVVSVGPDITDIKTGDLIAFSEHGGQTMLTKEKKLLKVLKYGEIYCIINEE